MKTQPVSSSARQNMTESDNRDAFFEDKGMRVLVSLRRIIRAVDIHSRRLYSLFNITAPQLLCLLTIEREGPINLKSLATAVSLGPSTVNGIVDRLEARELIRRERSGSDRRHVFLRATSTGVELTRNAPLLLQDRLSEALRRLPETEQAAIVASLERIVEMMDAEHLEASPILAPQADISSLRDEPIKQVPDTVKESL